jgi:hypothetical protein
MVGVPFLAASVLVACLFVLQGRLRLDSLFASERRDRQEIADEIDVLLAVNHRLVGVLQAAFARDPSGSADRQARFPARRRLSRGRRTRAMGSGRSGLTAAAAGRPQPISAAAPLPAGSAFLRPDAEAYREELQAPWRPDP